MKNKIFLNQSDLLKAKFQTKRKIKIQIFRGKIFKIDLHNFYVRFDNKIGICSTKNITDFKNRIPNLLKLNNEYDFLLGDFIYERKEITEHLVVDCYWKLNYKIIHPEEIFRKNKPIPTASHFRNLKVFFDSIMAEPFLVSNSFEIIVFKNEWKKITKNKNFCYPFQKNKQIVN